MENQPTKANHLDPTAEERKRDHIDLAFKAIVSSKDLDDRFYYEPMLSGHPDAKSSEQSFLDKKFEAPIWVSSMTGGTAHASKINENLAKVCGEYGLGMGLGSCRQLLHSKDHFEDFDVRKFMGDQPLYANLGIAQVEELLETKSFSKAEELVDNLQADGLIIHVNPLQEWLQPEGDIIKYPPIETIEKVLDLSDMNIIVKEVGQGFGKASLEALMKLPLKAIDFGASGGTNFALLELFRSDQAHQDSFGQIANLGHSAEEMVKFVNELLESLGNSVQCDQFIISGGVKNFLDGFYHVNSIRTNAIYGQASPFLKYALMDYDSLKKHVETQLEGYKLAKALLRVRS